MPNKPPFCVIFNPSAGRGGSTSTWQAVQSLLGNDAEYRPTSRAGHAVELAEQAANDGYSTVVAAGGDGTVHEVINGLLRSKRADVAFSVLPLGSGNDYARLIQVPFDAHGMVERLLSPAIWPLDVGEAILDGTTQRFFCNTLGMGLGGAVTWEASKIRWMRGIPLYGWASMKALWKHFQTVPVNITSGGKEWKTTLVYAVAAQGRAEGGGFVVAPHAILDDGLLNFMYVSKITRLGALFVLPRLVISWLRSSCKSIHESLIQDMTLRFERPVPVHADGEMLATPEHGARECIIRIHPARLLIRGRPKPITSQPAVASNSTANHAEDRNC